MPSEARARRGEDADGVDDGERVDAIGDNGVSTDDGGDEDGNSQDNGVADEEAASQVCADATECERKKSATMVGII
jgi:hypothetical protein